MSESSTFSQVKETIIDSIPTLQGCYDSVANLDTRINEITFDSNNQLYQFFGSIRYVTGDVIYTVSFGIISLIVSFYIFRMLKRFVNFVLGFVPAVDIQIP